MASICKTTLDSVPQGDVCSVSGLDGDPHFISRTTAMGFTPGGRVHMVRNRGRLPLIVYLRDTLIAIDRDQAKRIEIHENR